MAVLLVALWLCSRDHFTTKNETSGPSEPLNTTAGIQGRSEGGGSVAATPGSRVLGAAMKRFYYLRSTNFKLWRQITGNAMNNYDFFMSHIQ